MRSGRRWREDRVERRHLVVEVLDALGEERSVNLVIDTWSRRVPGRKAAARFTSWCPLRSRSSARSSSGAVDTRLRIWFMAWLRALRAEDRATRSTRMASTLPFLVLASPLASPDCAARAAATASSGSDFSPPPAALAVGPVDFDHGDALVVEEAGQPGAVGTGALDTHQLDHAERAEPPPGTAIAGEGGVEGLDPEERARSSRAATTWTSRWVSTPAVMRSGMVVMVIPFV